MVHPCLKESLFKTVKWHRVPVLSQPWWISVHHAEQAVIIQLTSKLSPSGIAQEMFWDIWNRTQSVVMKPFTVNLSCCWLEQVSFLLFPLFCAAVLNCATDLVRGPQALSYKYSLPFRPSSDVMLLPCRTKLQFSKTVARQEIFSDSDVVPESNQIQDLMKPRNNSS